MLTLHQHPFELLEQQLRAAERPAAERVPAAEVHETVAGAVAAIFAVAQSSIDSGINSTTTVIMIDNQHHHHHDPNRQHSQ